MSLTSTTWPPTPLPQQIKDLLTKFFLCVDLPLDPTANTTLADEVFAHDATFTINKRVMRGREEIVNWRGGAASGSSVAVSRHDVDKVYLLDGGRSGEGKEVLTTGMLYLEMKDGKRAESPFAARGVFGEGEEGQGWRIREWQGWVDYVPYAQAGMFEIPRIYGDGKGAAG